MSFAIKTHRKYQVLCCTDT